MARNYVLYKVSFSVHSANDTANLSLTLWDLLRNKKFVVALDTWLGDNPDHNSGKWSRTKKRTEAFYIFHICINLLAYFVRGATFDATERSPQMK